MNNIIKRVWNQNRMVNIEGLSGAAFQAEDGGHTFQISGIDDTGAAVALTGTVAGVFRRPDNADIALTGSASGGVASVTLTDDCYAVPGRFGLTVFVTSDGQKTAVYACIGTVAGTNGGAVAGDTPQDVVDLINAISAAVATIPPSYTDLMAAIAPTYSNSALYPVGSYAWYDGDLYRCIVPITTAETWTASHWTITDIGGDMVHLRNVLSSKTGNLLPDYNAASWTSPTSISITRDGYALIINGTKENAGAVTITDQFALAAGSYEFGFGEDDALTDTGASIQLYAGGDVIAQTQTHTSVTVPSATNATFRILLNAGSTFTNLSVKPMLFSGSIPNTYVPQVSSIDYVSRNNIGVTEKLVEDVSDITDAVSTIDTSIGLTPITMTQGKVININVSTIDITALVDRAGYACAVVPCKQGDVFIVTAAGIGNYRSYGFCDANGIRKGYSGSGVVLNRERLIAPEKAAYLIINDGSGSVSYKGDYVISQLPGILKNSVGKIDRTPCKNLFDPYSKNIIDGFYMGADGGLVAAASYCISDYIPVTAGDTYAISNCYTSSSPSVAFYDASFDFLSTISGGPTSVTAPANSAYMRVTVLKANRYNKAQIEHGTATDYEPYDDRVYALNRETIKFSENALTSKGTNAPANTMIDAGKANISKNVIYSINATFDSFAGIEIGHGSDHVKYASWAVIDSTKITVYTNMGEANPRATEFVHGLTITKFLNVQIITGNGIGDQYNKCTIQIQTEKQGSEAGTYTTDPVLWIGNSGKNTSSPGGNYYVTPSMILTDYVFTVIFRDATKPIYLFGDSYMSFTNNRWVYYLQSVNQFNNVLINAVGGGNSARTMLALDYLQGKPKFALWALGMNDSSDTDASTPAENWMTGVTAFLAWCSARNCTPVFGTIPTTPDYESGGSTHSGKYNEAKNAWIRSSGYRYIDFAKAYGADAQGNWYTGMLTDGDFVHPTALGAIAAFNRALTDFPEIMGDL